MCRPWAGAVAVAQRELVEMEETVDWSSVALWGLSERDLEDVRASLRELKG